MDSFARKGVKRLLGLAKTKVRLAVEHGSVETRPAPLPLVKRLAGAEVKTVGEAGGHLAALKEGLDFADSRAAASAVFQLLDIIEGVKYGFEPEDAFNLVGEAELRRIEAECAGGGRPLNLMLLASDAPVGVSLFVGEKPPAGAVHLGYAVSTLAFFLDYAFRSEYFTDGRRLKNIVVLTTGGNLLASTAGWAVGVFTDEDGSAIINGKS